MIELCAVVLCNLNIMHILTHGNYCYHILIVDSHIYHVSCESTMQYAIIAIFHLKFVKHQLCKMTYNSTKQLPFPVVDWDPMSDSLYSAGSKKRMVMNHAGSYGYFLHQSNYMVCLYICLQRLQHVLKLIYGQILLLQSGFFFSQQKRTRDVINKAAASL